MGINKRIWVLGLLALVLTGCGGGGGISSRQADPQVTVSFLAVGQADATYLKMPNGQSVLIDGGTNDDVIEQLKAVGAPRTIDLVIMTHPHIDHIGGLFKVIDQYTVRQVWETGACAPVISSEWRATLQNHHIPDRLVKAGDSEDFGGAQLTVLAPSQTHEGELVSDPNEYSLVCQLEYGNFKTLFMADATIDEQKTFAAKLGPVDIFKVPHHGAANAAWEDTYVRTRPKIAILTVGIQSQLVGLPTPQATELLKEYAGKVYRTYPDGTMTFFSTGK